MPSSLDAIMQSVEHSPSHARKVVDNMIAPQTRIVLFQGPPGCGKSTLAREVAEILGDRGVIVSADHTFETESYSKERVGYAHAQCQQAAKDALKEGKIVLVDNTNIKANHAQPYRDMVDANLRRTVVVVQLCPRNDMEAQRCAERGVHAPAEYSMKAYREMERIPKLPCLTLYPRF